MITFDEIVNFLSDSYGLPADELTPDMDLTSTFGIDSLGLVTLGDRIQDRYGVVLPASDLVECRTIGDFQALIERITADDESDQAS